MAGVRRRPIVEGRPEDGPRSAWDRDEIESNWERGKILLFVRSGR